MGHDSWDVAIIDGEPVKLTAESDAQLAQLRLLVDARSDEVLEVVREAKEASGTTDGCVELSLDPELVEAMKKKALRDTARKIETRDTLL